MSGNKPSRSCSIQTNMHKTVDVADANWKSSRVTFPTILFVLQITIFPRTKISSPNHKAILSFGLCALCHAINIIIFTQTTSYQFRLNWGYSQSRLLECWSVDLLGCEPDGLALRCTPQGPSAFCGWVLRSKAARLSCDCFVCLLCLCFVCLSVCLSVCTLLKKEK